MAAKGIWDSAQLREAMLTYKGFEQEWVDKVRLPEGLLTGKQAQFMDWLKGEAFNKYLARQMSPRAVSLYSGLPVKRGTSAPEISKIEQILSGTKQLTWSVPQLVGFLQGKVPQIEIEPRAPGKLSATPEK